jgi:hypothetical protein
MIRTKLLLGCALVAAMSLSLAADSSAQPADQRTYFTFSAPFELPGGKTLPAGKYTFRIADSPSNRHIVQVLSEDGNQIHATVLAIPAQRQDPPSEPEVRFMEAAATMPPAIRTWWYTGRSIGHEFIYPKDQARRLAARQTEPVLTTAGTSSSTDDMQTADLSRISSSGQETRVAEANARAQSAPAPAPRADQLPPARDTAAREPRRELSTTASPLPLIGLVGLASIAGAVALRLRRASR